MEENMQPMKHLALGALSMALATTGIAAAGGDNEQHPAHSQGSATEQGGRGAAPAPRTGSASTSTASMDRAASSNQGSSSAAPSTRRAHMEQAQRELASRGLYRGTIDGIAGPQTMEALRQFQEQQGMPPSGQLDESTRQALGIQLDKQTVSGAQTSSAPELQRPVGREGVSPPGTDGKPMRLQVQLDQLSQAQLRTLQTRLRELGFYQGVVDGVLGEGTRTALRQFFQTQADLASRGIITDATIASFGVSPQGLNPSQSGNAQTSGSSSADPRMGNPQGQSQTPANPGATRPRTNEPRGGMNEPSDTGTQRPGSSTPQPTNPSQGIR
jgi:peptidoglycan hydrolase-like protein with peptidoglycan-binding domain